MKRHCEQRIVYEIPMKMQPWTMRYWGEMNTQCARCPTRCVPTPMRLSSTMRRASNRGESEPPNHIILSSWTFTLTSCACWMMSLYILCVTTDVKPDALDNRRENLDFSPQYTLTVIYVTRSNSMSRTLNTWTPAEGIHCWKGSKVRRARGVSATFKMSSPRPACDIPPSELSNITPFADWLKERVQHAQCLGERLDEDIIQYACPPKRYATLHRQMYCFGMHLRVWTSEGSLVTKDSCVVAAFTQ